MIRIREALPGDALDVARAHVRSWQAGYEGLIAQEYLDKLRPEDRASRYTFAQMNPRGPFTQVAVEADTICGFVTTGRARDDDLRGGGEIWAIYVDPPRWGGGVGRRLMAAGCAHLVGQGHDTALLWVLSGNVRARRFYERVGWRWDGARRTDQIGDTLVHEVRYQRPL
jgi:ribosomal protein S18 acetylase RimI-like enzyme